MSHLINSLKFEMFCSDEWQAFNLRENFAQTFQPQIQEIVDRVCSELVPEDQLVRIDCLEIEMGTFSPHSFGTSFGTVFAYQFERALREKLAKSSPEEKQAAIQYSATETIEFFLETGSLPWWIGEKDIDFAALSAVAFEKNTAPILQFFNAQRENVVLWRRAAWQMTAGAKSALLWYFPELQEALNVLIHWRTSLSGLEELPETLSIADLSDERMSELVLLYAPAVFKTSDVSTALWLPFAAEIKKQAQKNGVTDFDIQQLIAALVTKENIDPVTATGAHAPIVDMPPEKVYDEPDEKYFVSHAGIILLTPFFKQFFTTLDLFKDGEWTSPEAHMKAVHLLGFLSTGEQHLPEYALTLEKIICGMPVAMPLQLDIDLTESDIENCNDLLQSVITHWTVLKNTSIDGLRGNFLVRDGLLRTHENGWQLQVERKTLDVLLDQLPWGFTTAAFPWRPDLILTEW